MADSSTKSRDFTTDFIKSDIDNVTFLGNPHIDNMLSAIIAVSAEIWTDRRRMRVIEKLLAAKGVTTDMIEQYVPSPEDLAVWDKERKELVERVFDQFARNEGTFNVASPWNGK